MSLYYVLLIMMFAGIAGGAINSLLSQKDSNDQPLKTSYFFRCVLIGLGATILIPLFLEIAQSKLLDDIRLSWQLSAKGIEVPVLRDNNEANNRKIKKDTTDKSSDTTFKNLIILQKKAQSNLQSETPPIKTYLLFCAYCFLAAVAGPRFINSLVDGVLKDKEIDKLHKEKEEITQVKDRVVKTQALERVRNSILAENDETKAFDESSQNITLATIVKPKIGPKTVANDPQKGRFGGKDQNNKRRLCASVMKTTNPLLFKVSIWVESTDSTKPLDSDVVFYLHDTFRPSVITVKSDEFTNERAELDSKIAWGAFTVGAVTDNGDTLLELDLSEHHSFPLEFRSK